MSTSALDWHKTLVLLKKKKKRLYLNKLIKVNALLYISEALINIVRVSFHQYINMKTSTIKNHMACVIFSAVGHNVFVGVVS